MSKAAQIKFESCKTCPFHKEFTIGKFHLKLWKLDIDSLGKTFITCGTYLGNDVVKTSSGETVELCGCVMNLKAFMTDLIDYKCPAKRW